MRRHAEPDQPIRRFGVRSQTEEYAPSQLSIDEAIQAIQYEQWEWLYVFDPAGKQIARFRGTEDEVAVSDELARRQRARGLYGDPVLKDCTIVHNHPSEATASAVPVSPSDLLFAVAHDLHQLIVISGRQRFDVVRPDDGWPLDESETVRAFADLVEFLEESEGVAAQTREDLARRNLRILELMRDGGLISYEQSTIADND
jgi:hypothetical protein